MRGVTKNIMKFGITLFLLVSHLILLGSMTQVQAQEFLLLDRPASVSKISDLQFALLDTQKSNTSITMDLSGAISSKNKRMQSTDSRPIELSITGDPQHVFAISLGSNVVLSNGDTSLAMRNIQHSGSQFFQFNEYGDYNLKASGSFDIPQTSSPQHREYVGILPITVEY